MSYTYTLPITAFLNDQVAVNIFHGEVEALGLASAVLQGIATHEHDEGTDVNVIFDVEPDASDKAEVDAAAAVHDGEDEADLAITDLLVEVDKGRDVRVVDYKTGLIERLHKVVTNVYRGEVREVDYFVDATEADLVLSVKVYADEACTTLGYSRNSLGSPVERWTRRTWYRKDGSVGVTKTTHKVYTHDPAAQMREGMRRRTNVIDKMSIDVLQAHVFTTATDPMSPTDLELATSYNVVTEYMDKYEASVTTFIRTGRHDFTEPPDNPNITDDTESWLDNDVEAMGYPAGWTIRAILLESIKNISE